MDPINPQNNQPVNSNPPSSLSLQTSSWESRDLKNQFYTELFAAINADADPIEFTPHSISPAESVESTSVESTSVKSTLLTDPGALGVDLGAVGAAGQLATTFEGGQGVLSEIAAAIGQAKVSVEFLKNGLKGLLISSLNELCDLKKKNLKTETDPEKRKILQSEISELKEVIKKSKIEITEDLKQQTFTLGLMTPRSIAIIQQLMGIASSVPLGDVILGFNVVAAFLQLQSAKKALAGYAENTKLYTENKPIADFSEKELKEQHETNLSNNKVKLQKILDEIGGLDSKDEILTKLKNSGITSVEKYKDKTIDEIKAYVQNKDKFDKLNKQMVLSQEGKVTLLRNGIRTFMGCKTKIDKGGLSFNVLKSKVSACVASMLAVKSVISLVVAKIVVGLVAGVALGLTFTGYGLLGLIALATVGGAVYFYCNKPNLFKAYCKGIPLQIFIKKTGLMISEFNLQRQKLNLQKTIEKIKEIGHENLSAIDYFPDNNQEIEPLIPELEQQVSRYEKKIEGLEKIVQAKQEKIDVLKAKKFEAGYKDFMEKLSSGSKQGKRFEDSCDVMAEYLLSHAEGDSICEGFKGLAGIDNGDNIHKASLKIKHLFGMESQEALKKMLQNKKESEA